MSRCEGSCMSCPLGAEGIAVKQCGTEGTVRIWQFGRAKIREPCPLDLCSLPSLQVVIGGWKSLVLIYLNGSKEHFCTNSNNLCFLWKSAKTKTAVIAVGMLWWLDCLYFIYYFYFEKLMDFQSEAALYLREQYILFMSGSCIVYMKTLLTAQIWWAAAW